MKRASRDADLLIACTSRDEINVIPALLARNLCRGEDDRAHDQRRSTSRSGGTALDFDYIVSSELETAHAVSRYIGLPAAQID